jgi:DNA repair photolyase
MVVREVFARSILNKSKIYDYALNPYIGCQHGCTYCYARFMKKFTGHREPWGKYVDVKINAPDLLRKEVKRKPKGNVWISGVCDPYQPLEKRYRLTRACLEILVEDNWAIRVQTRSPLVVRDIDILKNATDIEVGLSVTTANDSVRKLFEPFAPSISSRLEALQELHNAGIRTCAMIAPMLPGAEGLANELTGKVDHVLADRLNYRYADWVFKKHHLEYAMTDEFFRRTSRELAADFERVGIEYRAVC